MKPNNICQNCKCIDGSCYNKTLDLDLAVDPSDLLAVDPSELVSLSIEPINIEIPILNPKINVNMDEELEPLENLIDTKVDIDLHKVMNDIENNANFNSVEESIDALHNPDIIFTRLQTAFDTFKQLIGRQMTYGEMRQMMG